MSNTFKRSLERKGIVCVDLLRVGVTSVSAYIPVDEKFVDDERFGVVTGPAHLTDFNRGVNFYNDHFSTLADSGSSEYRQHRDGYAGEYHVSELLRRLSAGKDFVVGAPVLHNTNPYDLEVIEGQGDKVFVEVKLMVGGGFYISAQEMLFANTHRASYVLCAIRRTGYKDAKRLHVRCMKCPKFYFGEQNLSVLQKYLGPQKMGEYAKSDDDISRLVRDFQDADLQATPKKPRYFGQMSMAPAGVLSDRLEGQADESFDQEDIRLDINELMKPSSVPLIAKGKKSFMFGIRKPN